VTIRITGQPPTDGKDSWPELAVLEAGPVRIWTRLIEGQFPPYRRVFPQGDHAHQFALPLEQFPRIRKVLRAMDAMARKGAGLVTLRFADTQLTAEAHEDDVGSIRSRLPVNRHNGTLKAEGTYQARFLRDMLETFESLGEPAYVSLNGDGAGFFLAPCGITCIIMGVR
jgi:DNA polymerase III sliding clamp (beta) subunit (PCNA family)